MSDFEWGVIGLAAICSSYLLVVGLWELWKARQAMRLARQR